MHLSPLDPAQRPLADITRFIVALNRKPAHHIGYCGTDPEEIAQALQSFEVPVQESFLVAQEHDRIVGVLGFESDAALGRAWLYGPFVHHVNWKMVADRLYHALLPLLPPAIHQLELFCNRKHTRCQAFAARHGFSPHGEHVILRCDRHAHTDGARAEVQELAATHASQVTALHDRLFPHTCYSGQQLLERLNHVRNVFVVTDGGVLQGYTYVEVEPEFGDGRIEFVGVTEQARGKGIGLRLVSAAIHWLFSFETVKHISLTTSATNVAAIRLYEKAGFVHEHTMCCFRKAYHRGA